MPSHPPPIRAIIFDIDVIVRVPTEFFHVSHMPPFGPEAKSGVLDFLRLIKFDEEVATNINGKKGM
jgi:hypothetical protein